MVTDLFAASSGLNSGAILAAVPPSCRREIAPAPEPRVIGDEATVEFPAWPARRPARHLLPALSLLGADDYTFRFELSARVRGAWTPWVGTEGIGPGELPSIAASAAGLTVDVDVVTCADAVESVRLRLRVRAPGVRDLMARPWLATLSTCDLDAPAAAGPESAPSRPPVALPVPCASQMQEADILRTRICSPTSVAMVLGYWGVRAPVAALARAAFHARLDLYGVWPAAVRAAASRGVLGYLLRFPDWEAAAWCLDQGLPIIASVRYAEGELAGVAMAATTGHLLVLRGHDGDTVLVNDPAAEDATSVGRRCRRDQLVRAWLDRAGVGYVLFIPGARR